MKVLKAIHALLKAEGKATRASIKQYAPSLSHRHIVDTINANKDRLRINSRGAITGLVVLRFDDFKKRGAKYFRPYEVEWYGHHHFNALAFPDADDLKEKYERHAYDGMPGDVHHMVGTEDTPELRAELDARGYRIWDPKIGEVEYTWSEAE